MIRNYLKVAWRNLIKNKIFSVINITGLAIGLSCFLLITLYVLDELSYDKSYPNASRIYRINSDIRFGGSDLHLPVASDPMGATLKKDYPQVEEFTRLYANGNKQIKKGNEFINEFNVIHADSTFFSVFQQPLVAGDPKHVLDEPNTVVISASAARKYFNSTEVIGQTIETTDNGKTVYKITAVVKDFPANSHIGFDFIFSMKNVNYQWGNFLSNNFYTYLLLQKGTDYKAFEKNFHAVLEKYVVAQAKQFMEVKSMDDFEKAGNKLVYSLIPITKIHLTSDRQFELSPSGNIQYVYIFSAVAIFLLLIACINFMNLTTARSSSRAREVGIRKVLGTERKNLISQFLTESTLMATLSMLLAIGICSLVLPLFNTISGKSMKTDSIFHSGLLPVLIGLPLIVGVLAGSYPAFFLSGFRPIEALKNKLNLTSRKAGFRSTLVVFQFWISIIIIISTIVVYKQLNYIRNKNLGFSKDQVLIINDAYALNRNSESFKNEMLRLPGVISGTISPYLPVTNSSRSDNTFSKEAVLDSKSGLDMQNWTVDYDYIPTMGMQMKNGRNFSPDYGGDSAAVIINEEAEKFFEFKDPIGQTIYTMNPNPQIGPSPLKIIGVVKNFHFESLKKNIGPLCFQLSKSPGLASFKIRAGNTTEILKAAESNWKAMAPGMPFSYRFLDESFNDMYRSESRAGKIAMIFSFLTILVACLGLFGLATYTAEQRRKEIGIRKVLGAGVNGIVRLLSIDFLKLVSIAFVIAVPAGWWFMHTWLKDYAYRVNIGWEIFLVAGFLAGLIALLTISFQAIRAAIANPVKSLRAE
ncbi:MAG TPA: ABC transporter permease [Chitinophagaceae bacterium]|nr:ABC transporter permease [Chitinophagaceae bacterium]